MQKEDVRAEISRDPFVPLRLHLSTGKTFDIPFREVARMLPYGLLVFIGKKEGTHSSEGFDRFSFDQILRIEQRPARRTRSRRKKAS